MRRVEMRLRDVYLRVCSGIAGETGHEQQHRQNGEGEETGEIRIGFHGGEVGRSYLPAYGDSGDLGGLGGDEQDQQRENDDGEEHAVSILQGADGPLIDNPDTAH